MDAGIFHDRNEDTVAQAENIRYQKTRTRRSVRGKNMSFHTAAAANIFP